MRTTITTYGVKVREPVRWFAQQMEKKLQENDHKGGWDSERFDQLLYSLKDEVVELTYAILSYEIRTNNVDDIINEAADVANFAMMIADLARQRRLKNEK